MTNTWCGVYVDMYDQKQYFYSGQNDSCTRLAS